MEPEILPKVRNLEEFDTTKVFLKSFQAEHFRPWSCVPFFQIG